MPHKATTLEKDVLKFEPRKALQNQGQKMPKRQIAPTSRRSKNTMFEREHFEIWAKKCTETNKKRQKDESHQFHVGAGDPKSHVEGQRDPREEVQMVSRVFGGR